MQHSLIHRPVVSPLRWPQSSSPKFKENQLKYLILFVCFFHVMCSATGQSLGKKSLKLFNSSIQQENKKKLSIGSNPWVSCNTDSSFYKTDTLILYKNYYDCTNCKDFIEWTFYRRNSYYLGGSLMCDEPTRRKVYKDDRMYSIRVQKNSKGEVLEIIKGRKVVSTFRVLSIQQVTLPKTNLKSTMTICLLRQS